MIVPSHRVSVVIFDDEETAKDHRFYHGGRVFIPNEPNGYYPWFRMDIKPAEIMTHPATHGLSGRIE